MRSLIAVAPARSRDSGNTVLAKRFPGGQLVLTGRSSESGESRIELPIDHSGATVRIKLDPRFVSDFLRVLDADTAVTVELTDAQSAAVCTTTDGYGYVIMPLAAD